MTAMQRSRRLARPLHLVHKYSLGFLFVVLTAMCVWPAVSRYALEGCENGSVGLVSPNGARQLLNVPDQFTREQKKQGAVLLHVFGLLYMFIAIAIVCDECFVPALEVISEVLHLSPNVAGATFMAAGGSAPEFCISLIGVMVTTNDIGTGTIIGSAVFNVLFVIGMCAIVAKEPLHLTWFPLARDSIFYSVDLFVLTVIFLDDRVMWYEALILFTLYLIYITFMVYSDCIEAWATDKITKRVEPLGEQQQDRDGNNHWATSRDKLGDLQGLPASDVATAGTGDTGEVHLEKPSCQFVGIVTTTPSARSLSVAESAGPMGVDTKKHFKHHTMRSSMAHPHAKVLENPPASTGGSPEEPGVIPGLSLPQAVPEEDSTPVPQGTAQQMELTNGVPLPPDAPPLVQSPSPEHQPNVLEEGEDPKKEDDKDGDDQPLSFFPPAEEDTTKNDWVYYVFTLPIVFLLVITIPDVRRKGCRKLYALTFLMSMLWIVLLTWAMVWFSRAIAETADVGDHIMGLTVLAAGTSVPDMLTSMIVAREGHGDMAISSSIGSNIFDVTVGMPIPWLLFAGVHRRPVRIVNEGLEISIILLLGMLGVTIGTIMFHGWRMTRWMGGSMLFLYFVFVAISIGLAIFTQTGGSLKLIRV